MAEIGRRSCIGIEYESSTVDIRNNRVKERSTKRWRKDNDDRTKYHPKRLGSHRSSKEVGHRCKVSHASLHDTLTDHPRLFLDMVQQPAKRIHFGMPIEVYAVVGVNSSLFRDRLNADSLDLSNFFAGVSLVADQRNGERMAVEGGALKGQKILDSVHPVSKDHHELLPQSQLYRNAVGYCYFPGLLIRQPGVYRLRITLFEMASHHVTGATSILNVDSDPIKIE